MSALEPDSCELPRVNGLRAQPQRPITPGPVDDDAVVSSSQVTLPSTEAPASPMDPSLSFKTELNDDRLSPSAVIPSSLTPPPSSQMPTVNGAGGVGAPSADFPRQPASSSILSPPITGLNSTARRDADAAAAEFTRPSPSRVLEAPPDELRRLVHSCVNEITRLNLEVAHLKLQNHLLSTTALDDASRAAVELESAEREIIALRSDLDARQAKRELSTADNRWQTKYFGLQAAYDELHAAHRKLEKRLSKAKGIIKEKDHELGVLSDEKELLLNRLAENRDHMHILRSPGGIFHSATQALSTPVQHHSRPTPRQTPKSAAHRGAVDGRPDSSQQNEQGGFAALLQVACQENNSAPSTPTASHRPALNRSVSKHTRNVQSMSSLPTTPATRPHGEYASLLPSVDLVPQSEPPHRFGGGGARPHNGRDHGRHPHDHHHFVPETPPSRAHGDMDGGRRSRESTISAEDNEELARQALQTVAAAASAAASRISLPSQRPSHPSHSHSLSQPISLSSSARHLLRGEDGDVRDAEIYESRASQAASEMLRRDPRESFEVASSAGGSPDVTPGADKGAKFQSKLLSSVSKRKFNTSGAVFDESDRHEDDDAASPSKKLKLAGLRDNRVGLGIQYSQEV